MCDAEGARLHHIGWVVDSIEGRLAAYRETLGAASCTQVFEDPVQRVRVAFLQFPNSAGVQLELVEPVGPDSPVVAFLGSGGGLHHLCYEVNDLGSTIGAMKARRAVLVRKPRPAVAFGGRRIAWMLTPDSRLVEYLEKQSPSA